jgi:hypothetical protein
MLKQGRRWLPGRPLVWVVAGGFAAVSLALACVKSRVGMVSRRRWAAALSHRTGPQPSGQRGPKPLKGARQRRLPAWAARADTPWEDVAVDWDGGPRQKWWVFSRTALWHTPGLPPADLRLVLVGDPAGKWRVEAFFCTDPPATAVEILPWVGRRWAVEVTCADARAQLGFEPPRQWSDKAIARPTPVLWARFSLITVLPLQGSHGGPIPVPVTAWSRPREPPFSDGLALVRQHLWRARSCVNSADEPECVPVPRETFELWRTGFPLAA